MMQIYEEAKVDGDGNEYLSRSIKLKDISEGTSIKGKIKELVAEGESQFGKWQMYGFDLDTSNLKQYMLINKDTSEENVVSGGNVEDVVVFPSKKSMPLFEKYTGQDVEITSTKKEGKKGKFTNYVIKPLGESAPKSLPKKPVKLASKSVTPTQEQKAIIDLLKDAGDDFDDLDYWKLSFEDNNVTTNNIEQLFEKRGEY